MKWQAKVPVYHLSLRFHFLKLCFSSDNLLFWIPMQTFCTFRFFVSLHSFFSSLAECGSSSSVHPPEPNTLNQIDECSTFSGKCFFFWFFLEFFYKRVLRPSCLLLLLSETSKSLCMNTTNNPNGFYFIP